MTLDLEVDLEMPKNSLMRFNPCNRLIDNMFKSGGGGHYDIDYVVISVIKFTEIRH